MDGKSEEIKMKNIEIKEEIQEEILPSSTVKDTCTVEDSCTVYINEDDVKVEIREAQGNSGVKIIYIYTISYL